MARLVDVDLTQGEARGREVLRRLRTAFATEGLHIVLPLAAEAFARVSGTSTLTEDGRDAPAGDLILVGDGGPTFFARFARFARLQSTRAPSESAHPLDDFTRGRVDEIVAAVLGSAGIPSGVYYPFSPPDGVPLPFQRLGHAAGLPDPGPLGLQIHPVFGPWWAYRALIATPLILPREPPVSSACDPCPRPCVTECAVHGASGCGDECGARVRCPFGSAHRYPDDQLAFHARAREALLAALAAR